MWKVHWNCLRTFYTDFNSEMQKFPISISVLPNTRTLRISKIIVPSFIDVRNVASLECIYEIGTRKLNSVKWYKNDKEFYRWENFFVVKCIQRKWILFHYANDSLFYPKPLSDLSIICKKKTSSFVKLLKNYISLWISMSLNSFSNINANLCDFRYAPMMNQTKNMMFPVDGVNVQSDHICNDKFCIVHLDNLSNDSTGSYRCEVSGDAPDFRIVHETSNMTIIGKLSSKILFFFILHWKNSSQC